MRYCTNSFEWQKVERNVFRPKLDFLNDRSPHRSVSTHSQNSPFLPQHVQLNTSIRCESFYVLFLSSCCFSSYFRNDFCFSDSFVHSCWVSLFFSCFLPVQIFSLYLGCLSACVFFVVVFCSSLAQ